MDDKTYNEASIRGLAATFAQFYDELRKQGIPKEDALSMTNTYISEISAGAREINDRRGRPDGDGKED